MRTGVCRSHTLKPEAAQGEAQASLSDSSPAGVGAQVHSVLRAAQGAVKPDLLAAVAQVLLLVYDQFLIGQSIN